jgi:hypothetical protein
MTKLSFENPKQKFKCKLDRQFLKLMDLIKRFKQKISSIKVELNQKNLVVFSGCFLALIYSCGFLYSKRYDYDSVVNSIVEGSFTNYEESAIPFANFSAVKKIISENQLKNIYYYIADPKANCSYLSFNLLYSFYPVVLKRLRSAPEINEKLTSDSVLISEVPIDHLDQTITESKLIDYYVYQKQ